MIHAAVIGVGYWGPNMVRNLATHPDIRLRWLCDNNSQRLKKILHQYPMARATQRAQSIFEDTKTDLVVICTPVHTHFELAAAALKSGKHVLVSKPMASSEAECQLLIDLAETHNRVLMVDHTFVYHPAVKYLKSMMLSHELGRPLYFQSSRMNLGLYQPDVSVIFDLMPHDLSILGELIDEDPIEISITAKNAAGLPQPDIALLQLNYQSNFIASIHASWLSPSKVRETILTGSKKMVVYNDCDVVQKIKIFDKGVDSLDITDRESSYVNFLQYRQGDVLSPNLDNTEALKSEISHLVECIQTAQRPQTDGYSGLRVVRLLELADRLAQNRQSWSAISGKSTPRRASPPASTGDNVEISI